MAPFDSNLGARCNPVNTQNSTTPAADGNTTATYCSVTDLQPASTASMATAGWTSTAATELVAAAS